MKPLMFGLCLARLLDAREVQFRHLKVAACRFGTCFGCTDDMDHAGRVVDRDIELTAGPAAACFTFDRLQHVLVVFDRDVH